MNTHIYFSYFSELSKRMLGIEFVRSCYIFLREFLVLLIMTFLSRVFLYILCYNKKKSLDNLAYGCAINKLEKIKNFKYIYIAIYVYVDMYTYIDSLD